MFCSTYVGLSQSKDINKETCWSAKMWLIHVFLDTEYKIYQNVSY